RACLWRFRGFTQTHHVSAAQPIHIRRFSRRRFRRLHIQTSFRRSLCEPKTSFSDKRVNNITRGAREIPCIFAVAAFFGKVTLHCASTIWSNVQQDVPFHGHRGEWRPHDHLVV
ncbi:hypothetical protein DEU56DRAFT_976219, partial [Suillus clintonianus]|uniref:uncharacterized protein n=1 Tax=Suillus clintonianus TaxID=1904413 RepID=UPI001B85B871